MSPLGGYTLIFSLTVNILQYIWHRGEVTDRHLSLVTLQAFQSTFTSLIY